MHEAAWPSSLQSLLSLSSLHVLQLMLRATKIQTIISLGRRSFPLFPRDALRRRVVRPIVVIVVAVDASSSSSPYEFSATILASSGRCSCSRSSASLDTTTVRAVLRNPAEIFSLPRHFHPDGDRVGRKGRRKGLREHLLTEVKGAPSSSGALHRERRREEKSSAHHIM